MNGRAKATTRRMDRWAEPTMTRRMDGRAKATTRRMMDGQAKEKTTMMVRMGDDGKGNRQVEGTTTRMVGADDNKKEDGWEGR